MSKNRLCCVFNYAPLYRKSVYKKIDDYFDAQFFFSDMESDIEKMDYADFHKPPRTVRDRHILGIPLVWRFGILKLAFQNYKNYLVIGDAVLTYLIFIPLCHLLGKKVYAWGHGYKHFEGKMGWYVKWLSKHFDTFFIYGEGGKQRMVELGVDVNRLKVIYNSLNEGVNVKERMGFKSNKLKNHFANEYPVIVFVGRLTKVKQLDWIINAQLFHRSIGLSYNVLFIGDGSEKGNLQLLVKDNGLENSVWFYGACYDDNELSSLLYNADLCVSPGNVGLTALHAMSYGTPVISHDDFETQMPEYETIKVGVTGDLYKKGSFEDFCKKIENWLTMKLDREAVRKNCYDMINDKFNSNYQIEVLKSSIQ